MSKDIIIATLKHAEMIAKETLAKTLSVNGIVIYDEDKPKKARRNRVRLLKALNA